MLRNEMPASQHQRKRRKVNKMIIICGLLNFFTVNKITAAKSKGCNQIIFQFGQTHGCVETKLRKNSTIPAIQL